VQQLKLNAKLLVWAGATLTILSTALAAAQSLPASFPFPLPLYVYYLGGACGLSLLIGGALEVDWCQQ
jgi:hypothetical protein